MLLPARWQVGVCLACELRWRIGEYWHEHRSKKPDVGRDKARSLRLRITAPFPMLVSRNHRKYSHLDLAVHSMHDPALSSVIILHTFLPKSDPSQSTWLLYLIMMTILSAGFVHFELRFSLLDSCWIRSMMASSLQNSAMITTASQALLMATT